MLAKISLASLSLLSNRNCFPTSNDLPQSFLPSLSLSLPLRPSSPSSSAHLVMSQRRNSNGVQQGGADVPTPRMNVSLVHCKPRCRCSAERGRHAGGVGGGALVISLSWSWCVCECILKSLKSVRGADPS